jgi:antirestriction protein
MTRDISNHDDVDSETLSSALRSLKRSASLGWRASTCLGICLTVSLAGSIHGKLRGITIVSELEREAESYQESMDDWQANADGEAAIERLNAATDEVEYGETIGNWHYWMRGDWYPVTLIRDSYFVAAMQELCEDIGDVSKDLPSYIEIDWEATARNLRVDYSSVEFHGVTFWYR